VSIPNGLKSAFGALLVIATLFVAPNAASAASGLAADTHCNYSDPIAIKSARNGKYVTTERDYSGNNAGMLRARADAVGPWETYYLCYQDGWGPNEFAFLAAANNKFVSAEFDYSGTSKGMLRARTDEPGVWERFNWIYGLPSSQLQSTWTGQYVSTELDYTGTKYGMLRARSGSADIWEQFVILWQ